MAEPRDITPIIERIRTFNRDRDWGNYSPKDLAISLTLEAAEVLEHFQWRSDDEFAQHMKSHRTEVSDELADVFYNVLLLCDQLGINIIPATHAKIDKNALKYSVEKSRGNRKKYTELT
jgi:dCTP diphosphatase